MKKDKNPPKIRCADCGNAKPHIGLAVWCICHNAGRVANSIRVCSQFKKR